MDAKKSLNNKPYFIALNRIPGIGPKTIGKLLSRWPNLAELFQLPQTSLTQAGLPAKLVAALKGFDLSAIEHDLRWEQKSTKHRILTWEDSDYPRLLREIHDAPRVLYTIGDLSCLHAHAIGMVGTRRPSLIGQETAQQFARNLAAQQFVIVSGLALGIDAAAHQGALLAQGRTIAVLGAGVDYIYPYQHRHLAEKIQENGLLLSEFPLGTRPYAGHFPRRNRIISGLSLAILVVEAALKSGSLITAQLALEQNREVMAIPGSINNPQTKGCHYLLQQGAKLVTSVADILEELGLKNTAPSSQASHAALAKGEQTLIDCLGFEVASLDQILERSGLSFEEVAGQLAMLELKGVIKALPNGYMRCRL